MEKNEPKAGDALPRAGSQPELKPKQGDWDWKDAVTLPMSIAAFLISGVSTYFNVVRQTDDLRMLIPTVPFITLDQDRTRFAIEPSETVLFMNSGNRSAAVTFMQLHVRQDRKNQTDCDDSTGLMLEYEYEPFAIKPGEIVSKTMTLRGKRPPEYKEDPLKIAPNGFITFPIASDNDENDTHWIQVCMSVRVATPTSYKTVSNIELYRSKLDKKGEYILDTYVAGGLVDIPISLLTGWSTIFFGN